MCSRCKEEKDFSLFHNASNTTDGKQSQCKDCKREMGKVYESNRSKEKRKQYGRAEWKAKKKNPKYIEYRKKWLFDNRKEVAEKAKLYREKNKVFLLPNRSNQRAKKIGVSGKISMNEWKSALSLTNFMCISCEDALADTIDHVIPLSLGGTNTYDNIQPMCLRCNLKKGRRQVDFRSRDFAESIKKNCGR